MTQRRILVLLNENILGQKSWKEDVPKILAEKVLEEELSSTEN